MRDQYGPAFYKSGLQGQSEIGEWSVVGDPRGEVMVEISKPLNIAFKCEEG